MTLAAAAARNERRNRPTWLLLVGSLVLLLGTGYAVHRLRASSDAKAQAEAQRAQAGEVLQATARLKALIEAEDNSDAPRLGEGGANVLSRIEAAGPQAGLQKAVGVGTQQSIPDRALGIIQRRITYSLRDESLGAILAWAEQALADVPGLEVYSITVRPEASEWSVTITFARWEKQEAA